MVMLLCPNMYFCREIDIRTYRYSISRIENRPIPNNAPLSDFQFIRLSYLRSKINNSFRTDFDQTNFLIKKIPDYM